MRKIRKGDDVVVTLGKDRGQQGRVIKVVDDERVIVEGINMVKKHQKPNPNVGQQGGIISKAMPINVSNIKLFNPITQKPDRVGFKTLEDGRKVRIFKSNNEVVDV